MESIWTGVVLAAGKGVRMRSKTPKALHSVCGRPLLGYVAGAMRDSGMTRVVAVVSPQAKEDPRVLDAAGPGAEIAVQREQLGTADALLSARHTSAGALQVLVGAGDMPLVLPSTVKRMIERHEARRAWVTVLVSGKSPADGMGRVRLNSSGDPLAIIEDREATGADRALPWVNTSWYCFDAAWLWEALPGIKRTGEREAYLTDLVAIAARAGGKTAAVEVTDPLEALGVNDRAQLARAEAVMRERIRARCMSEGATLVDPATTYIDAGVTIGQDTIIHPGVHLRGGTVIGSECEIGPNSVLTDCRVGDRSKIIASFGDGAIVGVDVSVGPYSRLRPGTVILDRVRVGNFAEVKNSRVGEDSRIGHFSYTGDATLGRDVNIGAGTITCNWDGRDHLKTEIGDGAFIGSGTMLIAPRKVGVRARTGAGAIVTKDVPDGETWVGNPARPLKTAPPGPAREG